jgi:aldehyde dehydrogenase
LQRVAAIRRAARWTPTRMMGAQASAMQMDKIMSYLAVGKARRARQVLMRRRAARPSWAATSPAATTSSRRCSRATTTCASSARRSSARCWPSPPSRTKPRRCRSPTTRPTAWARACGRRDGSRAYRMGRAIQAGRVWTNCYHAYPAHAAFGGYKESGIGRETHKAMLDHYQQTKNLLVSYSPKALGLLLTVLRSCRPAGPAPWAGRASSWCCRPWTFHGSRPRRPPATQRIQACRRRWR